MSEIKNVVLVHGAFADGSGWRGVYDNLTKKGYRVSIVQNPLTSFEDDVAATTRVLDRQDGPAILVGHSWGGTVITEAGNHDKVAGPGLRPGDAAAHGDPHGCADHQRVRQPCAVHHAGRDGRRGHRGCGRGCGEGRRRLILRARREVARRASPPT